MKHRLTCLLLISTAIAHAVQPIGRAPAKAPKVPEGITYSVHQYRASEPARAGQLGIAYPQNAEKPLPVVICIHGGGWSKGDKDQMAWMAVRYAQRGYVGVTLSYRLTAEAAMPACVLDVKEAIRSIKAMSDQLPIDSKRIAVLGYSAGGHLALMVGLTADQEAFKSGANLDQDSSVNCVVAISAPTDLEERYRRHKKIRFSPNGEPVPQTLIHALSPLTYINSEQLPILLLHGNQDGLVPVYHMHNFASQSERLGIDNLELYEHRDGGHMFFWKHQKITQPIVDRFLSKQLHP